MGGKIYQPKLDAAVTGSQYRIARAGRVPSASPVARRGGNPPGTIFLKVTIGVTTTPDSRGRDRTGPVPERSSLYKPQLAHHVTHENLLPIGNFLGRSHSHEQGWAHVAQLDFLLVNDFV